MYTVRITHHPAAGKAPELRTALEEHSKAMNAGGPSHNVSQRLYAPEPAFVNTIRHESLAALEAYGQRTTGDAGWRARTTKISACLDRPQSSELHESLVAAAPTGEVNYLLRISYYPAAGKGAELRTALEKRARTPSPGSVGKGLSTQVVAPDGGNFTLGVLFSSLAGFEEYLKARPADPSIRTFAAQLSNLTVRVHQELYRILVRFTDK